MFSMLIDRFSTEQRVWELNENSEWTYDDFLISYPVINKSHYETNDNEKPYSKTKSSRNDLSSPSGMKKINEKLMYIDLFVDIGSKTDPSSQKSLFWGESAWKYCPY